MGGDTATGRHKQAQHLELHAIMLDRGVGAAGAGRQRHRRPPKDRVPSAYLHSLRQIAALRTRARTWRRRRTLSVDRCGRQRKQQEARGHRHA